MNNKESCLDFSKIKKKTNEKGFEPAFQTFHNLMPFKVREILLVSSLYDAFIVEEEGLISEMVIWEYRHLLLSSPPRVTHVTSGEEVLSKLKLRKYDLVITMSKNIGMDPYEFGRSIKKECPDLPVIILATDAADLHLCQENIDEIGIDKAFFWYGDTSLFLAIIKSIEDKINAEFDTKRGNVQLILIIEDSIRDYSMLLPVIYSEIVEQAQRSISEDLNEMQRLLRRRARPKILIAQNYEEGLKLYKKYKNNILGIISDVKFPRNGKLNPQAGHEFISYVKKSNPFIPTMLQSRDSENRKRAEKIGAFFINKNSPTLMQDFNHFLLKHLGFGDFVFYLLKLNHKKKETDKKHHKELIEIARASNLKEFEDSLQKVPLESIRYHTNRNDFSNWLMARCEFKLALKLRPQKVSDFKTLDEMRKYLINVFNESRKERQLGVMTDFHKQKFEFEASYTKIGSDSLGGKGRGIAFIRTLLARYSFNKKYPNVKITVPSTVAIGTDEFDNFISNNNLQKFLKNIDKFSNANISMEFLKGKLTNRLKKKLLVILKNMKKPIVVRSSSLLEDSQNFPFAGMYSTYMLPNNHMDDKIRLEQLCKAIKLVYASVFYNDARAYIESTSAKIEEEKMAVIIQELIGSNHNGRFYPTFSGVGQSYNYYPISHQTREDGVVSLAVGLGYSVVGGEQVLRFSPKYPNIITDFSNIDSILKNSQKELYVLNTKKSIVDLSEKEENTLEKINISDIINDGALGNIVSTLDRNDGIIRDGYSEDGPIIITFAGILKYNVFPLSSILIDILETGQKSMGCPVEIEFAVNFDSKNEKHPVFALIQIRPIIISQEHSQIQWDEKNFSTKQILIKSNKSLGNGVYNEIKDIIYVIPKTFDSSKTIEIAKEIGILNNNQKDNPYLLIGPGRWGTKDRWLGVPVNWSEISNVKVMVETSLEDYNIKPSQGTHFFQNIVSRGVGYININLNKKDSSLDWEWLKEKKAKHKLKYVRHISLKKPLMVKLDGRNGRAIILKPS
jgi:phosphoenolpyruvate synthase/pyruvate phosphate dikinase